MRKSTLCILLLAGLIGNTLAISNSTLIRGRIVDDDNTPLSGATIIIRSHQKVLMGTTSNENGQYEFEMVSGEFDSLTINCSIPGYIKYECDFQLVAGKLIIPEIHLEENPINLGTLIVMPAENLEISSISVEPEELRIKSRHSIITTNPITAIREPQIAREGSNHSSKIRVNGTSPTYFINGTEIGYDPNHYGMFSIIPGSVVEYLNMNLNGADASSGSPSTINFHTARPFGIKPTVEIDLSFIEGIGTLRMGDDRFFIITSMRKSFLDRLADKINSNPTNHSIPPTNFRDIFLSSGIRIGGNTKILLDSYLTGDYLTYDLGGTVNNPNGIRSYQNTSEEYIGLSLETLKGGAIFRVNGSIKESNELYKARSPQSDTNSSFLIDLSTTGKTIASDMEIEFNPARFNVKLGNEFRYLTAHKISLRQVNWNMLPPDANSDNPYIYQRELNAFYGSYKGNDDQQSNALYISIGRKLGKLEINGGFRFEQFKDLNAGNCPLYRFSAVYKSLTHGHLSFSNGTYAASPSNRILQPYQVLINAELARLEPIKTTITAANYELKFIKIGAFNRHITYLPRITPDFSRVIESSPQPGFIKMISDGQIHSLGGDIGFVFDGLLNSKFDFEISYGYCASNKITDEVSVPYELNASHRYFSEADFHITRHVMIGANVSVHSGYSYSEWPDRQSIPSGEIYSEDYYRSVLQKENSERFPANILANLYIDFNFEKIQFYITLSNLTNQKNPIIKLADGYIYDAGFLPSLGLKFKL